MVKFNRVAIVGVGLIGGSLALAARQKGIFNHIVGIGRNLENLRKAKGLNVVDEFTLNLVEGVKNAELVIIATPVKDIIPIIKKILPVLKKGVIITDVGSVKNEIMIEIDKLSLSGVFFVGSHPIAGTENSGVEAAFPDLFLEKKCILTPSKKTDPSALEKIKNLWVSVGSEVLFMDSEAHDQILGAVSHLPHMIAFAMVNYLYEITHEKENIFKFSGGGLKDFTRIAASHPIMWKDIALMNKDNLVSLLNGFQKALEELKGLINRGDGDELVRKFEESRRIRRGLIS
ncbi:MAG TPA: prephenate dehydrogenase/arogenate dehydrogenase family protein [Thermodesulfobacteriota bacterium]|nr:prephenate dehydrogenase/arogenate dehydrogenase family protein [Thermodesulfobacteriota bacterium]